MAIAHTKGSPVVEVSPFSWGIAQLNDDRHMYSKAPAKFRVKRTKLDRCVSPNVAAIEELLSMSSYLSSGAFGRQDFYRSLDWGCWHS
jgi:hypothetical protein